VVDSYWVVHFTHAAKNFGGNMTPERMEQWKRQYAGRRVVVDAQRPELARFAGMPARVATVNYNGRAMVQFDGPDASWHDIDPEFLQPEPRS
jgi:hypothetical protein